MPYIIKRFRKPCLAMTEDRPGPNGPYEYIDRHMRWTVDAKQARVFTQKGHAKNALTRAANHRSGWVGVGAEVMLQLVAFVSQGKPEMWLIS